VEGRELVLAAEDKEVAQGDFADAFGFELSEEAAIGCRKALDRTP
jgi:hypothetical protein